MRIGLSKFLVALPHQNLNRFRKNKKWEGDCQQRRSNCLDVVLPPGVDFKNLENKKWEGD
jgi:hypothetical protein